MYRGGKGWGENILCGWESGKEVGSRPPPTLLGTCAC